MNASVQAKGQADQQVAAQAAQQQAQRQGAGKPHHPRKEVMVMEPAGMPYCPRWIQHIMVVIRMAPVALAD